MNVLAYDLGGTKISAGIMNKNGKIIRHIREKIDLNKGKAALITQMSLIGKKLIQNEKVSKNVGLASAGPLDPARGLLLDPTNFKTQGKSWGIVPISLMLKKKLNKNILLENDADAAIMAEHWIGSAKNKKNAMILTLGTGLGTGIICNGQLVRSGHGLHPEGGHVIIHASDKEALCGCGNYGCAESYLSATNFAKRVSKKLGIKTNAPECVKRARSGDLKTKKFFNEYAENLAITINNFVVLYSPEVVILAGSFAQAHDLFLKKTNQKLEQLLKRRRKGIDLLPQIKISQLNNESCLIGAAYFAFKQK